MAVSFGTGSDREAGQAWLAAWLAWIAGATDSVVYLTMFHVFSGHQSGNSIRLGFHLGQGDYAAVLLRAFPIPLFVLGVALGAAFGEQGIRHGTRSRRAAVFMLEAALLVAFLALGETALHGSGRPADGWRFYLLLALPTLALGVQNATVRRVGQHTVRTTFVTGMLTDMAEGVVEYGYWLVDRLPRRRPAVGSLLRTSLRQPAPRRAVLYMAMCLAYVGGAALGGWSQLHWALFALSIPLAGLAVVVAYTLWRPAVPPPTPG
ncbi:MAG: YoaK family protein [Chloroflexota bacterium]